MTENKKLDVIRKLLAQAERAGTPEEAETFAGKAEALMARYSIDMAAVAAGDPRRADPIETLTIRLEGYPIPKAMLLQGIATNLSCQVILTSLVGQRGVKIATVYGHKSDLEAFDLLATSLLLQATTAATATHKRAPQVNGRTFRHNFLLGFAGQVSERMAAARSQAVEEASSSTALAVLDRSAKVRGRVEEDNPKLGKTGTRMTHTRSYLAGDEAGRRADLSDRTRIHNSGTPMLHGGN